jgi:hypothetical protein
VQVLDVDLVAGPVEEPPHGIHIGIAGRLDRRLFVPHRSARRRADLVGHLRWRNRVTGQFDALPDVLRRITRYLRDEGAQIRAAQLPQRAVGGQRRIEDPGVNPVGTAEGVVEEVRRSNDGVGQTACGQTLFGDYGVSGKRGMSFQECRDRCLSVRKLVGSFSTLDVRRVGHRIHKRACSDRRVEGVVAIEDEGGTRIAASSASGTLKIR